VKAIEWKSAAEAAIFLKRPALAASDPLNVGFASKCSIGIFGLRFLYHALIVQEEKPEKAAKTRFLRLFAAGFFSGLLALT
jgi:hypothetical protein